MLSQFIRFVRTGKGQIIVLLGFALIGLITLFALTGQLGGVQTLYKKAGEKSKPEIAQNQSTPKRGPANFITHSVARPLPTLALQTANGAALTLGDYSGELLLVNFWATWCAPCRKEMPQLDALARRYEGRGVRVIALSVDRGSPAKPEKFLNNLGISHMIRAFDPSYKAVRTAGLIGLPTTLLVDAQGREIGRLAGEADWDRPHVHELLDYYLAK